MSTNTSDVFVPTDWESLRRDLSPESLTHLEHSLAALEKGRDPTPSFPLYGLRGDELREKYLADCPWNLYPQWLTDYEIGRLEKKFGPQGGVIPWTRLVEPCALYKTAALPVTYIDAEIIAEMKRDYSFHLPLLPTSQVIPKMKEKDKLEDTANGWPEFQLKKTDPKAQALAIKLANNGGYRNGVGYVFSRYNKLKERIFFPMPFCQNVVQDKFFIPFLEKIQECCRTHTGLSVWSDKLGFPECFALMEKELQKAHIEPDENLFYWSNDFLKMDTCTAEEQYRHIVWPVMRCAVASLKYEDLMLGITAPIITPSGTLPGPHGTASGITMTNCGETVCSDYFIRRMRKLLKRYGIRVLCFRVNGDDSIVILVSKLSRDEVAEIIVRLSEKLQEETGFRVQNEKASVSDTFGVYCQNVLQYNRNTGKLFWCYPAALTFNSITNPEHEYTSKQWKPEFRDWDIIQKLDNSTGDPAYKWLVDWVDKGMKYGLASAKRDGERMSAAYAEYRSLQKSAERWNRDQWSPETSVTYNR